MKLEGYSNYEIYPETGQIWSYRYGKFLKFDISNNNYLRCTLTDDKGKRKRYLLHRLIWQIVNGDIPCKLQVNHIDEDKNNNSISNLNLMSPKENSNWGTRNQRIGEQHKNHFIKSKPVLALKDGNIEMFFPSAMEAERQGFDNSHINKCCQKQGYYKTHKGYQWMYLEDYLADWWEQEMERVA